MLYIAIKRWLSGKLLVSSAKPVSAGITHALGFETSYNGCCPCAGSHNAGFYRMAGLGHMAAGVS
jgi:hypothetical protein